MKIAPESSPPESFRVAETQRPKSPSPIALRGSSAAMAVGALVFGAGALIDALGTFLATNPALFLTVEDLRSPFYTVGMVLLGGGAVVRRMLGRKEERAARQREDDRR